MELIFEIGIVMGYILLFMVALKLITMIGGKKK